MRVARWRGGPDEVHPHGESSPRLVAAPGDRVALAWPNSVPRRGATVAGAMLRLARSDDGGATWSSPMTLNDDTTGAPVSHQFHGAAWQGDSGLVVAWLDERHAAARRAAGSTGPPPTRRARRHDLPRDLARFRRLLGAEPRLLVGGLPLLPGHARARSAGTAVAAWRKHFPGNVRDVVTAVVGDGPAPAPGRVHSDDWAYPGCPHSGPALSLGADGARHVAWYYGREGEAGVFYARATAGTEAHTRVGLVTGRKVPTAHPAVAPLADGGALAA